jgi:2-polyprenyl-6-methoxyphenol hydroxylase-like FAD-dependent oxidoreductase
MNPQILICGAGPTGLVLAIWLAKRRIPFRIIDKAAQHGTASRALVLHARTLEFYRQLGLDRAVVASSHPIDQARLWVHQHVAGTVKFGGVATDTTPFPYVLVFPQDEHEALLERELNQLGKKVERRTELLSYEECPGGLKVQLRKADGEPENGLFTWLIGCDGARSRVREITGAGFPGGTYEHTFYVADITGSGPVINHDLNIALDDSDFLAVFPLKEEGRARLIGTVETASETAEAMLPYDRGNSVGSGARDGGAQGHAEDRSTAEAVHPGDTIVAEAATTETLQWEDVSKDIFRRLKLDIKEVNWFSTYRVHHRVASFFRKGRVFLLGDAAHVHSPLGGQGMNTGIGDAINLGWKLEAVLRRGAPDSLLDTYEQERITFARNLVATTDRAFTFVNKKSSLATNVRTRIAPLVLPLLFERPGMRRYLFRLISQTRITYRNTPLATGVHGAIHSGDRLPWLRQQDNYAPLKSLDWQLHCYGDARLDLLTWCERTKLPLHFFLPAGPLKPGTLCLVRPDGYIGWIGRSNDLAALSRYVTQWRIA